MDFSESSRHRVSPSGRQSLQIINNHSELLVQDFALFKGWQDLRTLMSVQGFEILALSSE